MQAENGLHLQIIEKDWWVTAVLRALFALPYAEHISFKGGTNLSKCWHLISRMSEDADIAIDREYLGFNGKLSKTQISDKLRRASCSFVRERLQYDLAEQLIRDGISKDAFTVSVNITPVTTTDPEIIEVAYHPAFDDNVYIRPKVIIEVSGRLGLPFRASRNRAAQKLPAATISVPLRFLCSGNGTITPTPRHGV